MTKRQRRVKQVQANIAKNIPQSRVHLNLIDHRYFDADTGEIYKSVTTKLGILSNPIFSDRKMNRSMEYILDNFAKTSSTFLNNEGATEEALTKKQLTQLLEEAREYSTELFKEASIRGTLAHKYVDTYINSWIKNEKRPVIEDILGTEPNYKQWSALRSFVKWSKENDFTPIASELMVWSKRHNLAGTLDCIGLLGDDLAVLDWKTSQVIIKSYYLQVSAYSGMFKTLTGLRPKRNMIVKLDLKQGQSHFEEVFDQPLHYQTYILCSRLYDRLIKLSTEINQHKPKLVI